MQGGEIRPKRWLRAVLFIYTCLVAEVICAILVVVLFPEQADVRNYSTVELTVGFFWYFPIGLGLDTSGLPEFTPHFIYFCIFLMALMVSSRKVFKYIFGALVVLLMINIGGCIQFFSTKI